MSIALIESHSVFVFCPFMVPAPSLLPLLIFHPLTDEQPVKVKRKKSFNLSRKFPFYKSKENIVVDLVDSERKYQPCDPQCAAGRGGGASSFSVHTFIAFSLWTSIFEPPPTSRE